jgi:hypothetical protein
MASAGYGTETTVESMWSTTWDTTIFDHWNKLIGNLFNAEIMGTAATDTTNTDVKAELAAQTHLIFAEVQAQAKISAVTNPWDFLPTYAAMNLVGNNFKRKFSVTIDRCAKLLDQTEIIEVVSISSFGASSDL